MPILVCAACFSSTLTIFRSLNFAHANHTPKATSAVMIPGTIRLATSPSSTSFITPAEATTNEPIATRTPKAAITQPNHSRPKNDAIGLARSGPRNTTAIRAVPAERPTIFAPSEPGFRKPATNDTTLTATNSAPSTRRIFEVPARSVCVSRSAASGFTRPDLIAGAIADRTVTTVPTSIPTTIVRGFKTKPELGRPPPPNWSSKALMPRATTMPPATPTAEASKPTISASPKVADRIWERDAPKIRSPAISFVRWVTKIENEFEITKIPTNNATTAKAVKNVLMKPNTVSMNDCCSFANASPVMTSRSLSPTTSAAFTAASTLVRSTAESATVAFLSPRTRIDCDSPARNSNCWPADFSKKTDVAPRALSEAPKVASPTRVNSLTPFSVLILTRSPSL